MQTTTATKAKKNGHAPKPEAPPAPVSAIAMTEVRAVPVELAKVHESPFNRRRSWGNLEELAASFRSVGVLEDLLGRPHPEKSGEVELAAGHRRLRAAQLANLPAVPVKIRELTDDQVLEIQIAENLQRSDITPMEEAETFELLRDRGHVSADEIAARVGKSRAYVYQRLKLLELCPEGRKAFAEDKISASVALYVARLPARIQKEALEDLDEEMYDDEPVTARRAFEIIDGRYMLRLDQAPFDRSDATLLPSAGSCKDCPKRTGNQRELFADVKSKDVCTDPECFGAKKEAHGQRLLDQAVAKGRTVLEGREAQDALSYGGAFVPLDDHISPPYDPKAPDDENDDEKQPTYRELAKDAELEIVVAKDSRGEIKELVRKKDVEPIIKKAGLKDDNLREYAGARAASRGDEEKKRREAAARKRAATIAVAGAVVAAAEKKVPGSNVWPFLARLLIDLVGHDAGLEILKRRGVDTQRASGVHHDAVESKLRKLLDGMKDEQARGLVVELAASRGTFQFGPYSGEGLSAALKSAAEFYKVDVAKVGGAARAELAAKKKAKKVAKTVAPTRKGKK